MIIVLLDEPGLFVFPSPSAAEREIEPIDAESEIRAAFDDSAIPYRVDWIRPNQRSRALFGLINSITPGEYRLVPDGPANPKELVRLLEAHPDHTTPPNAKAELSSLLAKWRAG